MAKESAMGITAKKQEDMPEWYSQVVLKSRLADYSPIKGCMVIRPAGFSIWQSIQDRFNARLRDLGVDNAYFPLFIPESFFAKEAEHAEGFSPEVAWIQNKDDNSERLAIRPTSETIMYDSYSRWIRSWRDLPLRLNQWCNIVRWEVSDVKLFLRSREFLWQEGHCVYASKEETDKEVLGILDEYADLCENLLAIPVLKGRKTDKEKFAGALYTTTIEAFMPDGKSLQMGTSHNLGTGFAKAFGIEYVGKDEKKHSPWQSSWGFSTRLIGGMVMLHSDDKGLVLPPRVAKNKAAIVPILFDDTKDKVIGEARKVEKELADMNPLLDTREEYSSGWKFNEWELKGIPIRIEIGPRDLEKDQVVIVRRDTGRKEFVKRSQLKEKVSDILDDMQDSLLKNAQEFLESSIVKASDWSSFESAIKRRKLVKAAFCGEVSCEDHIKDKTGGATSRCIPFVRDAKDGDDVVKAKGSCVHCGKDAKFVTYFSKNY